MDTVKFKPGDRVRYVGNSYPETITTGTVLRITTCKVFPLRVLFDHVIKRQEDEALWAVGSTGLLCAEHELVLENQEGNNEPF